MRNLFHIVRKLTGRFHPRINNIKDKNGELLIDQDMVVDRWREYCQQLYSEPQLQSQQNKLETKVYEREPPPLKSEILAAIKKLSRNKAPGADGIPAELYKAGGDVMADVIHPHCVWKYGTLGNGQKIGLNLSLCHCRKRRLGNL